jgi:hypothetical protein
VAAAGEDLDGLVGQVDLNPVAIELDFVNPARSGPYAETAPPNSTHTRSAIQIGTAGFVPEPVNPCCVASAPTMTTGGDFRWQQRKGSGKDGARACPGPVEGRRRPEVRSELRGQEDWALGAGSEEGRQEGRQRPRQGGKEAGAQEVSYRARRSIRRAFGAGVPDRIQNFPDLRHGGVRGEAHRRMVPRDVDGMTAGMRICRSRAHRIARFTSAWTKC